MIVSDATHLIAFSKIDRLDLLREIVGGRLVIPAAVAAEISAFSASRPGGLDLREEPWIRIERLESERQVELLLPSLDRGEAEVIALACERSAHLVLIDEWTGRKVAESLGLSITGSVGVLIQAKRQGAIHAVKPLLERMLEEGLFFSARFVRAVLVEVGEELP